MKILRYKVTVEAQWEEERNAGKQWEIVGQKPDGKPEYGYTPEILKVERTSKTIYEQTVPALDMAALVSVVNGLVREAQKGAD